MNIFKLKKLKLKRDQETWKRRRRLYLFTSAFLGKEYTNKWFPFDEDTVKFGTYNTYFIFICFIY